VIYGGHAIVDGGLQIDGSEIGCINKEQILQVCEKFRQNNIRNVVVCGTYSPIDSTFNQEKLCKEIILENLGSINVFCSADREEIQHLSQTISELIALQWAGLVS
jgi:N-methylhydantoinase A/oxoprolinase/acetone carboxylase beta subunit